MIKKLLPFVAILLLLACSDKGNTELENYDIVILNARVIDPESGRDEVCNVGINGSIIAKITTEKLLGKKTIDGKGRVLSPGFVDLHAHGQTNVENEFQAFDGVTTALELEVGVDTIVEWFAARKDKALLNFGASACQLAFRNKVIDGSNRVKADIFEELSDSAAFVALPNKQFKQLNEKLTKALKSGAIGIGVPVGYLPAASAEEIAAVYQLAGKLQVPVFSHVREGGAIAFQQAIADAILTKAPLHICHINSMARKDIHFCLELVRKSQKRGFPITTELYPYTAANTEIGSAVFEPGWEERLGCHHEDLQWVETNERLTPASFEAYRKKGGSVIIHMMKEEWIKEALQTDFCMVASDGGSYSEFGHPRSSGTFAKIIRKYVMEDRSLTLKQALEKMTIMPTRVIEKYVPEMKKRGRIQEGCYADLLLFDPKKVKDNATFDKGFKRSSGFDYVIVNGRVLIENGKMEKSVFPGVAIKSQRKH